MAGLKGESARKKAEDLLFGYSKAVYTKPSRPSSSRPKKTYSPKRGTFKSGKSAVKNLVYASKKSPEVTVKVTRPKGNSAKTIKGVKNHLDYISRNGKLELEDKNGNKHLGKGVTKAITKNWNEIGLIKDEANRKQHLSIVLSMPKGTDKEALYKASTNFAKDLFSDNHEYVLALHTDTETPHVHLAVTMMGHNGTRLNPRKNDLFEWRVLFAEKLRNEGIECCATKRVHRGITQTQKSGIVKRIDDRGDYSFVKHMQAINLKEHIKNGTFPTNELIKNQQFSREEIVKGYKILARQLFLEGAKKEAKAISTLSKEMENKSFTTQEQEEFFKAKKGEFTNTFNVYSCLDDIKNITNKDDIFNYLKGKNLSDTQLKQLSKHCFITGNKKQASIVSKYAKEISLLKDIELVL
ncbi:relaxase/mobilization nuclease domain-containing protein [Taylorella equigenitalis]|uniref:relaxase/mobilization nuclease domain-containing protein n=1 Tax=Taylorella equigenitalis TaxID=29575 RepID=UPI00237CE3BB|nr:relaxase/mobilization nuclease domain-containing protein [Taylorella equigenitalis]WDU48978.1 relaxase/mobilization nuclease domain-containing protein [Taylorella equigenitalis]WDU51453.1 relaxase/mobilization nuclease domain-containing protein [Taylorella equigenitalis]